MAGPVPFLTSVITSSVGTAASFNLFSWLAAFACVSGIRFAMEGRLLAAMSSAAANVICRLTRVRRTRTRRMLLRSTGEAHEQAIQAQHVVRRVRKRTAFRE